MLPIRKLKGSRVDAELIRKYQRQIDEICSCKPTLSSAVAMLKCAVAQITEGIPLATADSEVVWWTKAFLRACEDHHSDLLTLAPWLALDDAPKGFWLNAESEVRAGNDTDAMSYLRIQLAKLDTRATLNDISQLPTTVLPSIENLLANARDEARDWLIKLRDALSQGAQNAVGRIRLITELSRTCHEFAAMDYSFLYCPARELFATGYNFSDLKLDASYYDLLASEARLVSYIVVAQSGFGQEHWFALGRLLTSSGRLPALLSWSGSMFEYLMPLLVMPNYEHTLLDRTYQAIVRRQIGYGQQRGVPWGISESGYNATDAQRNYQYKAFGVPGLGLKRGLR